MNTQIRGTASSIEPPNIQLRIINQSISEFQQQIIMDYSTALRNIESIKSDTQRLKRLQQQLEDKQKELEQAINLIDQKKQPEIKAYLEDALGQHNTQYIKGLKDFNEMAPRLISKIQRLKNDQLLAKAENDDIKKIDEYLNTDQDVTVCIKLLYDIKKVKVLDYDEFRQYENQYNERMDSSSSSPTRQSKVEINQLKQINQCLKFMDLPEKQQKYIKTQSEFLIEQQQQNKQLQEYKLCIIIPVQEKSCGLIVVNYEQRQIQIYFNGSDRLNMRTFTEQYWPGFAIVENAQFTPMTKEEQLNKILQTVGLSNGINFNNNAQQDLFRFFRNVANMASK